MRDLGDAVDNDEIQRRYFAVANALDKMAERAEIDFVVGKLVRDSR
jgi:hypothetical protein